MMISLAWVTLDIRVLLPAGRCGAALFLGGRAPFAGRVVLSSECKGSGQPCKFRNPRLTPKVIGCRSAEWGSAVFAQHSLALAVFRLRRPGIAGDCPFVGPPGRHRLENPERTSG